MTDPRITKGLELLAAYEADPVSAETYLCCTNFMFDNAAFFLRDLPARVAELEEGLNEVSRFTPEMAENLANWIDGKSPHDVAQSGLRRLAENLRRAASLLSDSKAGEDVPDPAYQYALGLATALRKKHYPEVTQWEPLDTTLGLLTQIDNMVAGLAPTPPEASDDLVERVADRLRPFVTGTVDEYEIDIRNMARAALLAMLDGGRDG